MLRNKKGFTLVELMVVIVIIGLLAALAIPKFTDASAKAKISEAPTVLATFDNACLARLAEVSTEPAGFGDLVIEDPTPAAFSKWFTYAGNFAVGGPTGLDGSADNDMGDVIAGDLVQTSIANDNTVTHAKNANYDKYLPNW